MNRRIEGLTTHCFPNYDPNGNRTKLSLNAAVVGTYKTDSGGTTQYALDFENRLKQATLPNGNVVAYKYDALGRRTERTATIGSPLPLTTTARFIYDGADVIRDLDGNGITTADYLNGPGIDNKLRQMTATAALYFVQDHLGSTRALTGRGRAFGAPPSPGTIFLVSMQIRLDLLSMIE